MSKKSKKYPKLAKYNLSRADLANIFKYASENSFNSSSANKRILNAVEEIISYVENRILENLKR